MAPDSDSAIETEFTLAGPIPYIPAESTKAPAPNNGVNPPIIYDGAIKKRIRRPLDLARFAVAISLVLGTIALGYFATSTTAGLDTDIEGGVCPFTITRRFGTKCSWRESAHWDFLLLDQSV